MMHVFHNILTEVFVTFQPSWKIVITQAGGFKHQDSSAATFTKECWTLDSFAPTCGNSKGSP